MNSNGWKLKKRRFSISPDGFLPVAFRVAASMTILASILFFPWWVGVALGVFATLYFQKFYEIVALAFLFDILYGTKIEFFYGFQFVFAAGAIVLLVISEWVKGYLRWY